MLQPNSKNLFGDGIEDLEGFDVEKHGFQAGFDEVVEGLYVGFEELLKRV